MVKMPYGKIKLCFLLVCISTTIQAGPAFKPDDPLRDVAVWTNANAKWFKYPEASKLSDYYLPNIDARPNFGIALSGGGYRAATLALGYLRALHMMNVSAQARYLSSNSGGSWFNAAFSYQHVLPVNEFLGPYVSPGNLTLDALSGVSQGSEGAFATTISESSIVWGGLTGAFADVLTKSNRGPGAWSMSVGEAFLKPYGLNADKSTITTNGTAGDIHTALQQLGDIQTYTYHAKYDNWTDGNIPRPFPIILGSIFNRADSTSSFYPVEFTPLYIGCPAVFPSPTHPEETVGGGFVEPLGFNSAPPNPKPELPPALAASIWVAEPEGSDDVTSASLTAAAAAAVTQGAAATVSAAPPAAAAVTSAGHRLLLQVNRTAATAAAAPTAVNGAAAPQPAAAAAAAQRGESVVPASAAAAAAAAAPNTTRQAAAAPDLNAELPLDVSVTSTFIVPLKIMVGISSSFMAQGLRPEGGVLQELTGTEELDYWNQVNFQGKQQPFADGGGVDNIAITPLLRRNVTHIVSCIAAVVHIDERMSADDWAVGQWDIAALFGAVPLVHSGIRDGRVNGMTPEQLNRATQVFPKSGWSQLFSALQSSVAQGGPVHHLATYTVMDNPHQAVRGGWEVRVLWVTNALHTGWEAQLPPETQGTLAKSRFKNGGLFEDDKEMRDAAPDAGSGKAELKRFPYINTVDANYHPELTGLLSQLASWQMLQLQPQLTRLLAGTGATVAKPRNIGSATRDTNIGHPDYEPPTSGARSGAGLIRAAQQFSTWLVVAAAAMVLAL